MNGENTAVVGPDDPELRKAPAAFRTVVKIASQNWEFGRLTFVLPSGREVRIEGAQPGPEARLIVKDFRFVPRVLAGGDIGFGEGFMAGEWDTPDLSALLEAFTANFDRLRRLRGRQVSSCGRSTSWRTPCTATAAPARGATSSPTTTSATPSIRAGSTPR